MEWLYSATDGKINVYDESLVQNIGQFIYRVQIADRYFINFADAPPMVTPALSVCYGYGKRIGDADMMALGAWSADRQNVHVNGLGDSIGRQLSALPMLEEILTADPTPPLPRDVFLDTIEVFVGWDEKGSTDGFFVGAKGGHNAESHNHNDIGHVVVSIDGKPVLVDAGVETYTAKTFSSERYTIWTMQSAYHTLPTVNGQMQIPGRIYSAEGIEYKYEIAAKDVSYQTDDAKAEFKLDIANGYAPEAKIKSWNRTVTLNRGEDVTIADAYELESMTGVTSMNVLTACEVEKAEPGNLALKEAQLSDDRVSGTATLVYDGDAFDVAIEPVVIEDARLKRIWGGKLTRIVFAMKEPKQKGEWRIQITR